MMKTSSPIPSPVIRLLTVMALFALIPTATAQKLSRSVRKALVDSVLTAQYYRSPYDTNYVVRPEGRLTLKVRANHSGNTFHTKGTVNDIYSKANLSTSYKNTFAVAAIYRGIGIGTAINPAKWKGAYKDYELNFNYYSNRLSLDASYQRSESLSGNIYSEMGSEPSTQHRRLEHGDVTMKVLNVAGYYIFNHRRFSYSAAFTQSYIQRRSVGSWLAGFSYQAGSIKTTDELIARSPTAPEVRIYVGHFGIGGGYGYNWVLGRKWLLHLSLMPTFVVYNRNNLTINGERQKAHHMRLNMIFNERAAIVYNISPRYFAGANLTMNNSLFDSDAVVINQNKWRLRAFLGMRL